MNEYKVTYAFVVNGESYQGVTSFAPVWGVSGFNAAALAAFQSAWSSGLDGSVWIDFHKYLLAKKPSASECQEKLEGDGIMFIELQQENSNGGFTDLMRTIKQ